MNKIIFCLLILTFGFACGQNNSMERQLFIKRVTTDFSRNSYFLVLTVVTEKREEFSLIENNDLFIFFEKTKGYSQVIYSENIQKTLLNRLAVKVNEKDFSSLGFISFVNDDEIEADIKQGKNFVMKKYTTGGILKKDLSVNKRNLLIKAFYFWNVSAKVDDESGYVLIK